VKIHWTLSNKPFLLRTIGVDDFGVEFNIEYHAPRDSARMTARINREVRKGDKTLVSFDTANHVEREGINCDCVTLNYPY